MSETQTGSVKAAQWRPTVAPPESDLPGMPLRVGRFAMRAARAISYRTHSAMALLKRIKRNIVFPIRNVLLSHRPLTLAAGGQSFLLTPEGSMPLEMWAGRYFERQELEFILDALQPGMTFFDIGANVGLFSIPAAKKVQHGNVYAFEPTTWTFERLSKNVHLNNVSNLVAERSAVGDYAGEAILQINVPGKDGLNTIGKPAHEDSEVIGTETVPITTLDEYLLQKSISHVDVMKIDVEGAERFVFRGAANLLAGPDAPLILYESSYLTKGFSYHPVETMWLLERYGYSFFVIDSRTGQISIPPSGRAYDAMVIAVKPTHPAYPTIKESAR